MTLTQKDLQQIKEGAVGSWGLETIPAMQVAVYVMCGGGLLGRFASQQPADFYIDDRVGQLPYAKPKILEAVQVLAAIAQVDGLNPHELQPITLHNLRVF